MIPLLTFQDFNLEAWKELPSVGRMPNITWFKKEFLSCLDKKSLWNEYAKTSWFEKIDSRSKLFDLPEDLEIDQTANVPLRQLMRHISAFLKVLLLSIRQILLTRARKIRMPTRTCSRTSRIMLSEQIGRLPSWTLLMRSTSSGLTKAWLIPTFMV